MLSSDGGRGLRVPGPSWGLGRGRGAQWRAPGLAHCAGKSGGEDGGLLTVDFGSQGVGGASLGQ